MGIPIVEFMREYKSVLDRHYFYSHSLKNIKRGLNYFDNFFLFFKDYLHKNIFI